MKKRVWLVAAVISSAMMLCGFDSTQTAESVMKNAQEAALNMKAASVDVSINGVADVSVGKDGTNSTLNLYGIGDLAIDYTKEPMAAHISGKLDTQMGFVQKHPIDIYAVMDESGSSAVYTYSEDPSSGAGTWKKTVSDSELDLSVLSAIDPSILSMFGIQVTLSPQAEFVGSDECYVLSAVITKDVLNTVIAEAEQRTGRTFEQKDMLSVLEGIQLNIRYLVRTSDFMTAQIHIDLAGSDYSGAAAFLLGYMGGEDAEASVDTKDSEVDAIFSYDGVESVVVPEDVLAAAQ